MALFDESTKAAAMYSNVCTIRISPSSWGHYCIDVKLSRGNVIPSLNGSI